MKGTGKKKSMGASDALALSNPSATATDGCNFDLHGDSNLINNNVSCSNHIDASSSVAPLNISLLETNQEQNLDEVEEDGEEEEEDDENEDEATPTGASSERSKRDPKLDEGFYEIEAIRRKRVRKGQLQYLIKWRGWPETANTWEPLENLQSCSDVIDAFEESLQSGKQRKRKRKSGVIHTQPKKKQQRTTYAPYNVEISVLDKHFPSTPQKNWSYTDFPDHGRVNNGRASSSGADIENECTNLNPQIDLGKEEKEYDPKLSELKMIVSNNSVGSAKLGIQFQEGKFSEGDGPVDGLSKVDCGEQVHGNRCIGAKRRKSGSVKRFRQEESTLSESGKNATTTTMNGGSDGRFEVVRDENPFGREKLSPNTKTDQSKKITGIAKIIKPIAYSASMSNNTQDVVVTFMALRSDGTEVMVDNKFLKANDPLLLINFYEQHLRYSLTS